MPRDADDHAAHAHDRGLAFDLSTLVTRRRALTLLAGAGLATVAACSSGSTARRSSTTSSTPRAATGAAAPIPDETAGPFPGDGSNGPDALDADGVVREDIRSDIGGGGTVDGVPLVLDLTVLRDAAPLAGAAVYVWHCDAQGRYSMYSDGVADATFLRGVQPANADGTVRFTSVFPGAYPGRWPHVHLEVFESVDAATSGGQALVTSQLALPQAASELVYAGSGYPQSARNLAQMSLAGDGVFGDGWDEQLAAVTGDVERGMTASLRVPV